MFRDAVQKAAKFTFPVILSRKTVGGICASAIGAFVVGNRDGWIVTAGHILGQWHTLIQGVESTRKAVAERQAIKDDAGLSNKERARRTAAVPLGKDDNERCSALWGPWHQARLIDYAFIDAKVPNFGEVADIGVGRLEPFDPTWVGEYPVFKDPKKSFEPGQSLCKLGFPLHEIKPSWDDARQLFILPPEATPLPRFPLEGMFTRICEVVVAGASNLPKYPFRYVETSTPGLKGQSGGPTFDRDGVVWAIQAKTSHYELGFNGPKQYLNVGLGVHPDTIFGLFDERKIKYQVSNN
jgi:hypothetical protein